MSLNSQARSIRSKAQFESFLQQLLRDFRSRGHTWENADLDSFLEGMYGFVKGLEGYYQHRGQEMDLDRADWRVFAEILLAARVYE